MELQEAQALQDLQQLERSGVTVIWPSSRKKTEASEVAAASAAATTARSTTQGRPSRLSGPGQIIPSNTQDRALADLLELQASGSPVILPSGKG